MKLLLSTCVVAVAAKVNGDGWNDKLAWNSLKEAYPVAKKEGKPIMTLIHQTWCGVCKALKPKFAASKEIQKLSEHFVMVNGGNDLEPKEAKFRPDGLKGSYYPRVIFLNPDGTRIDTVRGPNTEYTAFYPNPDEISKAMKKALKAAGIDLAAAEKAKQAADKKAKEEMMADHAQSVPGMLKEIFSKIDLDGDQVLNVDEFGSFVGKIGGAKPSEDQYLQMCKTYGTPNGLTFEKMSSVYAARGPDEINNAYKKIIGVAKTEL